MKKYKSTNKSLKEGGQSYLTEIHAWLRLKWMGGWAGSEITNGQTQLMWEFSSPWWTMLSQRKTPEFIIIEDLSTCQLMSSFSRETLRGWCSCCLFVHKTSLKSKIWLFAQHFSLSLSLFLSKIFSYRSPDSQSSNTNTDLGEFLVKSYAKQIKERNASTGQLKLINNFLLVFICSMKH